MLAQPADRCGEQPLCPRRLERPFPGTTFLHRSAASADPLLRKLGVRYLQIGGDVWNRCNDGWLNIDAAFMQEGLKDHQIATDDKGAHNMALYWGDSARLPFRSESVQMGERASACSSHWAPSLPCRCR